MHKNCKSCAQRAIVSNEEKGKKVYYNKCKIGKREMTNYKEDDFSNFVCKDFKAIECEIVEFKRKELFR